MMDSAPSTMDSPLAASSQFMNSNTIEIPLRGGDEVIEIDINQLPDGGEVINILIQEGAPLSVWINVALAYYKNKMHDEFEKILEEARENTASMPPPSEKESLQLLDMLAIFYGKKASKEMNKEKRAQLIAKATELFTAADRVAMYDQNHLLGRAFYFIYEGEKLSQADSQLNFVLNQGAPNVPAFLGKACIAFNKKEYKNALAFYRKALRLQPNCPASVRVGIGHCFVRLGNLKKARLAFQRALDLDSENVEALVGLAILDLNEKTQDSIKEGVQKLSRAYHVDTTNPVVLNHLADHFFYKKEYQKVDRLASHAFHNTENEAMRSESCYQIARALQVQGNYDKAFQYYYLATQFASPNFLLPFYGLGQMYLHRNDLEHAALAFEKVLKAFPNNYETLKILGSLYAQSNKVEKRAQAKELLRRVTESQPDDVEAWIEYAQLLDNDVSGALNAYLKALAILEADQIEESPEILNNIGSLYFMTKEFDKAGDFFQRALERIRTEAEKEPPRPGRRQRSLQFTTEPFDTVGAASTIAELRRRIQANPDLPAPSSDDDYYHDLAVTIGYNQARLLEAQNRQDLAESLYLSILQQHPSYLDCYLRLGCMARDRGQLRDASLWFREVLEIDRDHPDAWSLLGQLHLSVGEIELAQRKFERIVSQTDHRADAYARVTLGNVWLRSLHHVHHRPSAAGSAQARRKRHEERALSLYKNVLSADPQNIWAANGIGCVLAHKGFINEARDVFAQVREATADFPDVWMNIAHVYVEQKQYTAAIQMYENCMRKFNRTNDTELQLYLARAYFKAGQLRECKVVLLRARHIKPWDPLLTFNLALVQKRMAVLVLKDEASSFAAVCEAISDLSMARCTFEYLSKASEIVNQSVSLDEARSCQDLLSQAKYHLDRAKSREEQERLFRQQQEEEREAQRQKQAELLAKAEALRLERERRLEEERGKFIERAKQISLEAANIEKRLRKSGGKKRAAGDDFIDDNVSTISSADGEEGHKKSKRSRTSKKRGRERPSTSRPKSSGSGGGRVVSKALISDEDDTSSSSDEEKGANQATQEEVRPMPTFEEGDEELSLSGGETEKAPEAQKRSWNDEADSLSSASDDSMPRRKRRRARRAASSSEEEEMEEEREEEEPQRQKRPIETDSSDDDGATASKRIRRVLGSDSGDE